MLEVLDSTLFVRAGNNSAHYIWKLKRVLNLGLNQGKLRAAAAIAAKGVQVIIAEVGTEHAANALAGKVPEVCTVIKLRHNTDV